MRNGRNGGGIFIFIIFLVMFGSFGSFIPLLLIIGTVVAIAFAASSAANKNTNQNAYNRGYQRARGYQRTSTQFSAAQMAKVNVFLRRHFKQSRSLAIGTNIELRTHGVTYASLSSLDVYREGAYICSLDDFGRRYPDSYNEIMATILKLSEQPGDIIDAEATVTPEVKKEEDVKNTNPNKGAQYYIDTINSLNTNIPDKEITDGLFETTALLKQIQAFELKFPNSRTKLSKLYEYYLPILIRILKQYETLQDAKFDENYGPVREKLNKTIHLINDAMKTIISSMTDQDMMNLSADLTTLEALLQKDGLTSEGQMKQSMPKGGE